MTTTPAPRNRGQFPRRPKVEPVEPEEVEVVSEPEPEVSDFVPSNFEDAAADDDDADDDDADDDDASEPEPEPPARAYTPRHEAPPRHVERPLHDTTARVATYKLQVRVDQPGPALRDKRRGWIAIKGENVPLEVARWFSSSDCCRPDPSSGKRVFVWLDDTMVRDSSNDPIVQDGDEDGALVLRAPAAAGPPMPVLTEAGLQTTALIHQRLEVLTEGATRELERARENYHREMSRLQSKLEAEELKVEAAIEASKARMVLQLAREEELEEQADERLEKATERRKKMAVSIETDVDTYDEIREKMQRAVKPPTPTTASQTETVVAGIKQVVEIPIVSEVLGGFTLFFMKKLGVPVPTPGE